MLCLGVSFWATLAFASAQQCNLLLSLSGDSYQQGSNTWAAAPGTSVSAAFNRNAGQITYDSDENALFFRGGAVATAAINISPNVQPDLTIEVVVKPADSMNYATTNGWVVTSDNGGYDRSLALSDPRFGGVGAAAGFSRDSTLGYPTHNAWNFVAGVWNVNGQHSGAQQSFAWLNNTKGTAYGANNNLGANILRIGAYNPGDTNHDFNGWISEVKIYDCAKTEDQLHAAYQSFLDQYTQTTTSTQTTTTTTTNTATTRTVELQDITSDVSELFSEVGRLEGLIQRQANTISTQASQIADLTASTSSIRRALSSAVSQLPVTGTNNPSDDCISDPSDPSCVPAVVASGNNVNVAARGGRVTFDTGACGTVDPCNIVSMVEALSNTLGSL